MREPGAPTMTKKSCFAAPIHEHRQHTSVGLFVLLLFALLATDGLAPALGAGLLDQIVVVALLLQSPLALPQVFHHLLPHILLLLLELLLDLLG